MIGVDDARDDGQWMMDIATAMATGPRRRKEAPQDHADVRQHTRLDIENECVEIHSLIAKRMRASRSTA